MPIEITMPRLSDTMEQGTVVKWLRSEGDEVARGQVIGEVGDTGDSPAVHLHFQVMEGAAMRSIPFRFAGVRVLSRELGSWVEPAPAE